MYIINFFFSRFYSFFSKLSSLPHIDFSHNIVFEYINSSSFSCRYSSIRIEWHAMNYMIWLCYCMERKFTQPLKATENMVHTSLFLITMHAQFAKRHEQTIWLNRIWTRSLLLHLLSVHQAKWKEMLMYTRSFEIHCSPRYQMFV